MFAFERTDAFELILTELYESVFVPLTDLSQQNSTLTIQTHLLTGPGFQWSADGMKEQAEKSSIEAEVFRNGKQVLSYSLTYSDAYRDEDDNYTTAAFHRSIKTQFFDSSEQEQSAASEALANFDFNGPATEDDSKAWDSMRDFSLDPNQLKAEVREDLQELFLKVV